MKRVLAEHGVVCSLPDDRFGYFGWPSVARLADGTLVVASSGLRTAHICPWGRTVLCFSRDDGQTWSAPRVIHDSPIDNRDAGVVSLGTNKLLVSLFTSDTRYYVSADWPPLEEKESWMPTLNTWTDSIVNHWLGSWVLLSEDGGSSWSTLVRAPVSTPHGPIVRRDGSLLYFGKDSRDMEHGGILAACSADDGRTWEVLGTAPLIAGTIAGNYHEPHVVELSSGKLVGLIRLESCDADNGDVTQAGLISFSIVQTESTDGGATWTVPRPLGFHGSPPHLLRHSTGVLILSYGYRQPPYGQRLAFSRDEGEVWEHDFILRDDGPDGDLGYPASVELADGKLLTVYYQKPEKVSDRCALLYSRWQL